MSSLHEKANFITHFLGFLFGLGAVPALVFHTFETDTVSSAGVWAALVYGIAFLMVFGFSALYHYQRQPARKRLMKIWDHISIYYLIAGTYTPFLVRYATREEATTFLWILWALALAGTVYKIFLIGRYRFFSTMVYLAMGWMIVATPTSFREALSGESLFLIALGGGFYTVGVVFYLIRRIPFNHTIWHLFVLGGAVSHFIGVWNLYRV